MKTDIKKLDKAVKEQNRLLAQNGGCSSPVYLILLMILMTGCCPCRHLPTTGTVIYRDSILVDTRVETYTEYIRDTVFVDIPAQTAERTTQDSTSHLENDYAESNAVINPDGSLYHDLISKPQKIPKAIDIPVHHKDSTATRYQSTEIPVIVESDRDLTWWELTCITMFPWSLFVIAVIIVIKFRRPIFSFITKLISNV